MTAPARDVRGVLLLHEYGGGFGGAERYLETLSRGLSSRGVAVHVLVFTTDEPATARLHDRLVAAGASVEVRRGRSRPGAIASAVRRHRPDVLHWNSVDPFAFRGASWVLLPWRRPSVLTDHLPMLRAGPHWETTRRLVNRRVRAVIVVGDQGAAAARSHWPSLERLAVVRNGVDVHPDGGPPRPVAGPATLLVLGRLTDQKDPAFAVDVLAAARGRGLDVVLEVVGDGPAGAEVMARAAGLGVADHVRVLPAVDDVGGPLSRAAVVLAPSRYEGLPFTPLEALAAGVPVVLSDIGPHREIAAEGAGALLAPRQQVSAWADAVGELLRDRGSLRSRALAHAERFSADRMVAETLAVYAGDGV